MQINKKAFTVVGFVIFLILIAITIWILKTRILTSPSPTTQQLTVETVAQKPGTIVTGVSFDPTSTNQDVIWLTGTVEKIDQIQATLPATDTDQKKDIGFVLVQLTLAVPTQNSVKSIKALVAGIADVAVTTDGLNYKGIQALNLATTIRPGQLVRLNVINVSPAKYQNQWTKMYGQWNITGQMMVYLMKKYQNDTQLLLSTDASQLTTNELTVLFDGLLYNQGQK